MRAGAFAYSPTRLSSFQAAGRASFWTDAKGARRNSHPQIRGKPSSLRPDAERTLPAAAERRAEPRIYGPFPARVRGVDAGGARFNGEAALDDMSAADFNLCLPRRADVGRRLLVVIRLSGAVVALSGVVRLAEPHRDGGCRLNVRVTRYRFLPRAGGVLFHPFYFPRKGLNQKGSR